MRGGRAAFSGDSDKITMLRCPECNGEAVTFEVVHAMEQKSTSRRLASDFVAFEDGYAECDHPECGAVGTVKDFIPNPED